MSGRSSIGSMLALLMVLAWAGSTAAQHSNVWKGASRFENSEGSKWVEHAKEKLTYQFVETARTPQYVELFDKSRKVTVRLYADRYEVSSPDSKDKFKKYGEGKWLEPQLVGSYRAVGTNQAGKEFTDTVVLTARPGGGYFFKSSRGKGEAAWILGKLVSTDGVGVGIMRMEAGGKLVGSDFVPGAKGEGKATWTPIKK